MKDKIEISNGAFKIKQETTYAQISDIERLNKRQDHSEDLMHAVVVIVVVMVGAMIFSLQIANMQQLKQQGSNVVIIKDGEVVK